MTDTTTTGTTVPPTPGVEVHGGPLRVQGGQASSPGDFQEASPTKDTEEDADKLKGTGDAGDGVTGDAAAGSDGAGKDSAGDTGGDAADAKQEGAEGGQEVNPYEGLSEETVAVLTPFSEEFSTSGDLTPESITAAATGLGVPEDLVRFHLNQLKASNAALAAAQPAPVDDDAVAVFTEVGGQENYAGFKAWLDANHGDKIDRFAKARSAGVASDILKPYIAEWKASGEAPSTRRNAAVEGASGKGGSVEAASSEGYATYAEQMAGAREIDAKTGRPRQEVDPEYRRQHQAKVINASWRK